MRKTWNDWRLAVRMLCALALVFVAFAHKPITTASADQIDLAAYTLPDGTVPVLCLPGSGDQGSAQECLAWDGLRGLPAGRIVHSAGAARCIRSKAPS